MMFCKKIGFFVHFICFRLSKEAREMIDIGRVAAVRSVSSSSENRKIYWKIKLFFHVQQNCGQNNP